MLTTELRLTSVDDSSKSLLMIASKILLGPCLALVSPYKRTYRGSTTTGTLAKAVTTTRTSTKWDL